MMVVGFVRRVGWAAGVSLNEALTATSITSPFPHQHIMLVQRQMSVIEEDLEEFQLALKHYVESASAQSGCLR